MRLPREIARVHRPAHRNIQPGDVIRDSRGTLYEIQINGSWRRVDRLVKQMENALSDPPQPPRTP